MQMFFSATAKGFFALEIHGDSMPEDAVALSEAEYVALIAAQNAGATITADGSGAPVAAQPPSRSMDELKADARAAMRDYISRFLAQFVANTPSAEIASWPTKAAEARAFLAGGPASVIIQKEASVTGETVSNLAAIIVAKADRYSEIIGLVSGLRRKVDAEIDAASSPAALASVIQSSKSAATALAISVGAQPAP
jgi:hypothetical protein